MQVELKPCPFCGGEAVLSHYHGIAVNGYVVDCASDMEAGDGSHSSGTHSTKAEAIAAWNTSQEIAMFDNFRWPLGTRVTKTKGSQWTGKVVGFYSTSLTAEGYAVESETERGSVQIYPVAALKELGDD